MRYLPALLLALAAVLGLVAYAIWFVSDAHGHGLAYPDRRAIILLTVTSAIALGVGVVLFVRRPR